MVQVPLPQEPLTGGSTGGFTAPRVIPTRSAVGTQLQQLGQRLQQFGGAAADIADTLQKDTDNARTKEAYTLWDDEVVDSLYDPEKGYINKRGKDATGAERETVDEFIAARAETISQELDNDQQREMFREFVARRSSEVTTQMDIHQAKQVRVYQLGESKALLEAAASDAIEAISIGDLSTWKKQGNNATEQALIVAEGLDFGPERTKALVLETTTAIHGGVIQRLVSEDRADEALAYLERVEAEEIAPARRTQLRNLVNRASINDRSTTLALDLTDEIDAQLAKIDAEPVAEGQERVKTDEMDLLQQAQVTLDERFRTGAISAEERDATMDRIRETARQRRDTRISNTTESLTRAQSWLVDNPNAGITSLPSDLYEELREAGQLGNIAGFADGRRYTTDPQVYARVLNTRPEVLRQLTPGEFFLAMRPHLADQELREVTALYERATKGVGTADPKGLITDPQRFAEEAARMGVIDRTGGDSEAEATQLFRLKEQVDERLKAAQRLGKPTDVKSVFEEMRVDQAFIQQSFFGIDFLNPDDSVPIASLTEDQEERAFVRVQGEIVRLADIPGPRPGSLENSVRDLIVSALRREGLPTTQQAIAEVWVSQGKPQNVMEASQFESERQRRAQINAGAEPQLFGIGAGVQIPRARGSFGQGGRFPGLFNFLIGQ